MDLPVPPEGVHRRLERQVGLAEFLRRRLIPLVEAGAGQGHRRLLGEGPQEKLLDLRRGTGRADHQVPRPFAGHPEQVGPRPP